MAVTRRMTAKQNQITKRRKAAGDNADSSSWSNMIHDMLFLIILRLGVVDFISSSGVCMSWRTVAQSCRSLFMLTRQPLPIHISTHQVGKRKECYLVNSERREFKTILPRSTTGKTCVGLICGYVILYGKSTRDFLIVNPITRHELHFPHYPFYILPDIENFRCALVYSQKKSSWAFVVLTRFTRRVSFCFSSRRASWTHILSEFPLYDLQFCKGKLYTLNRGISLCEVTLDLAPALKPIETKNWVGSMLMFPELESFSGKLYVVGYNAKYERVTVEVDFDQMRWMSPANVLKEYTSLRSILKPGFTKVEFWKYPHEMYEKFGYFHGDDGYSDGERMVIIVNMWYFPHRCLDVNFLDE